MLRKHTIIHSVDCCQLFSLKLLQKVYTVYMLLVSLCAVKMVMEFVFIFYADRLHTNTGVQFPCITGRSRRGTKHSNIDKPSSLRNTYSVSRYSIIDQSADGNINWES